MGDRPAPSHRFHFPGTFGWRHSRSADITFGDEVGICCGRGILLKEIEERGPDWGQARLTAERGDRILAFGKITDYPAYIVLGLDRKAILAEWYRHLVIYGLMLLSRHWA